MSDDGKRLLVLYACDPLTDPQSLTLDQKFLAPESHRLLILMACEIPEESLVWFRKSLMPSAQLRRQVASREVELQEHILAVSKQFEHFGYEVDTKIQRGKHTGDIILEVSQEKKIDLIVLQRRRQRPWQRLLVGSVVDYVSKRASIPILILPP